MSAKLRSGIGKLRDNLIKLGRDQQLSRATLVILIFLDLFILISIFRGLDEHTRQLDAPAERLPEVCRQIAIHGRWNPTNRLDELTGIVNAFSTSHVRIEEEDWELHPLCARFVESIEKVKADVSLARLFEARRRDQQELRDIERKIGQLESAYATSLGESAAGRDEGQPGVASIAEEIRQQTAAMNALRAQLADRDARLNQSSPIAALWQEIEALTDADRERLKSDLRKLNFWFPLTRLGMQLLFLLPLFAAFYFWNSASIRRGWRVQTLVSSHLLVVSFIPIFCKIIEVIYDIIPKHLLERILDFLIALHLVAIWHYLIIAFAIGAALALIYVFQKKLFSHEKMLEKRIAKGLCQRCGKLLPAEARACPFCGFGQFETCTHCNGATHVHARYCRECGEPRA
jgi:RNA polymerase subunit RPABC4/transcription elongation factor Spt4